MSRNFSKIMLSTMAMSVMFTSCETGTEKEASSKDISSIKYTDIEVGKDFTDLSAKLTIVTN